MLSLLFVLDSDLGEDDYEEDDIYSLRMELEGEQFAVASRMAGNGRTKQSVRTVRCGQSVTLSCKRSARLAHKTIRWYRVENGERTFLIENVGKGWCRMDVRQLKCLLCFSIVPRSRKRSFIVMCAISMPANIGVR